LHRLNGGQIGPRISNPLRQRGVGGDAAAEVDLLCCAASHEGGIDQRPHPAQAAFVRVLEADERVHRDERLLVVLRTELRQAASELRRDQLIQRQYHIAQRRQLILCEKALRGAGAPRDEHRFAFLRAGRVPAEVRRSDGRLSVFIQPDERRIDRKSRKAEVVGIAAERRGAVFGSERQPHVGVHAIDIQLELSTAVQRHDRAPPRRIAAARLAFDAGGFRVARGCERAARQGPAGRLHARRDVADGQQDLGDGPWTLHLVLAPRRGEAGLGVVEGRRREVRDAGRHAMIVGQHQAGARDEAR
jgi:hypothetical protein